MLSYLLTICALMAISSRCAQTCFSPAISFLRMLLATRLVNTLHLANALWIGVILSVALHSRSPALLLQKQVPQSCSRASDTSSCPLNVILEVTLPYRYEMPHEIVKFAQRFLPRGNSTLEQYSTRELFKASDSTRTLHMCKFKSVVSTTQKG